MKTRVYNGCDRLDSPEVKAHLGGKRLGLLTNQSGVRRDLTLTADTLASKFHLVALFAPEHGIRGAAQDNCFDADGYRDPLTHLPVYNVFDGAGTSEEKAAEVIATLDAVVVDIQDVGVRYFTYQFAMLRIMRLCAKVGVELIVLDRICPIAPMGFGGQILEEGCTSIIGAVAGQSAVTGMTIGETALWFREHLALSLNVTVIPCENWDRSLWQDDTDLLYVCPSPNMTSVDCNLTYIAVCLFEQTTVSEGRGTTKPFELFGAPWMDPNRVIDGVNALPVEKKAAFEGLLLRPLYFTPTFHKYKGELCGGIQLHVRDRLSPDPFAAGLYLFDVLQDLYPEHFVIKEKITHLVGTAEILKKDFDTARYLASQKEPLAAFGAARKKHLLY